MVSWWEMSLYSTTESVFMLTQATSSFTYDALLNIPSVFSKSMMTMIGYFFELVLNTARLSLRESLIISTGSTTVSCGCGYV